MTGRTTRIATSGAGALLALGIFAAPAGASDGVQTDASVQAQTDLVSQTVDLVNQACFDATNVADGATASASVGSGLLGTDSGISVASQQAGSGLNLAVSLPQVTQSLPLVDSLLGDVTGQIEADPVQISCATSAEGTGVGLSAAGVEALVSAIAPSLDLAGLDLGSLLATPDVSASATATTAGPPAISAQAAAPAGSASATGRLTAKPPTVRTSAAAAQPETTLATAAETSPANGLVEATVGSPGALARTGAGLGGLGLLGSALFGSGRLIRRFTRLG